MNTIKTLTVAVLLTIAVIGNVNAEELTPAMQSCLSANYPEARFVAMFVQVAAQKHVGDDGVKAAREAFSNVLERKCDVRPSELNAAIDYLADEEKRQAIEKEKTPAAQARPDPSSAPLCRGRMTRDGCQP
jgi:hypothetical protein